VESSDVGSDGEAKRSEGSDGAASGGLDGSEAKDSAPDEVVEEVRSEGSGGGGGGETARSVTEEVALPPEVTPREGVGESYGSGFESYEAKGSEGNVSHDGDYSIGEVVVEDDPPVVEEGGGEVAVEDAGEAKRSEADVIASEGKSDEGGEAKGADGRGGVLELPLDGVRDAAEAKGMSEAKETSVETFEETLPDGRKRIVRRTRTVTTRRSEEASDLTES
jgi:hypothetical protein